MAELFELTGLDAVRNRLQAFSVEALPLLAIALEQEADAILEASQPLVPVDTASLLDSGTVDTPVLRGAVAEVTIRYGGTVGRAGRVPNTYAIRVHEDLGMRHPRGGTAKFLERPVFAATEGMLARLADAIRIAL